MASFNRGQGHIEPIKGDAFDIVRVVWGTGTDTEVHVNFMTGELNGQLYELLFAPVSAAGSSYNVYLYDPHDSDVLADMGAGLGTDAMPKRKYLYQEITTVSGRFLRPLLISSAYRYRLRITAEAGRTGVLDLIFLPPQPYWSG